MKKILLFCLIFSLLLLTVGCTSGESEDVGETEQTTNGTTADGQPADTSPAQKETEIFDTSAQITPAEKSASVKTAVGLTYDATGYLGIKDGMFRITDGFAAVFGKDAYTIPFNRFRIRYSADQPVKLEVTYTQEDAEKTDTYYLEAGTELFCGLISDYLADKKGSSITKVTAAACTGEETSFLLCGFDVMDYDILKNETYYLENDRFKVGVQLKWGGGINYIQDKTCSVQGLNNLINRHDTGRLIQQSYYGTGENGVFTPGKFMGGEWCYNPVQGGDQFQNHSVLIDIVIKKNSVYIKSQPRDWACEAYLTPSYMENTYTVYADRICVDNRFVDFSGWEHPYKNQELPAFYTISYLDSFVCYTGNEPWTGKALTTRNDLQFWGDAQYSLDCTFKLRQANTETWCAWVNGADNYGIGLYVPNVDVLFAGRYAYNGAMNALDDACNYVAPLNHIKMVSFTPITYSYMITAGTVENIREVFTEHQNFTTNASLHENYVSSRLADPATDFTDIDFTKEEKSALFTPVGNAILIYDKEQSALKMTALGDDAQATLDFTGLTKKFDATSYTTLTLEYMIPTESTAAAQSGCEFFLCTGDIMDAQGGKSVRPSYVCDGEYHTLTVSLKNLAYWSGTINRIRFDFFNSSSANDYMFIRSFTLS